MPKSRQEAPKGKSTVQRHNDIETTTNSGWRVVAGELASGPGRPRSNANLFRIVAEKLPYALLADVKADVIARHQLVKPRGVYVAHDSMGYPRYIGRGYIFDRLKARKILHPLQLQYFSFFVVDNANHEREIETVLIRIASGLIDLNDRKKRTDHEGGDVRDYEPRTHFYERKGYPHDVELR